MNKMYTVKELYKKAVDDSLDLLPSNTSLTFWDAVYTGTAKPVYDREFARRYTDFKYYDFMEAETAANALSNLKSDILSILTFNKKRYEEMYRVFLVSDADDPITYNYDMTETTGKQHSTIQYGNTSRTKGEQINTEGAVTDTHSVAPFDSDTPVTESTDAKTSQTFTEGSRTDTETAHTDTSDSDEWTLTRKGNIGVQTAGDILRIHTNYWTETYKFLNLIFDDICKQLLLIGD